MDAPLAEKCGRTLVYEMRVSGNVTGWAGFFDGNAVPAGQAKVRARWLPPTGGV